MPISFLKKLARDVVPEPASHLDADELSTPENDSGQPETRQFDNIARAAVEIAAIGPKVEILASTMREQAQAQARRAVDAATAMAGLTDDLESAVEELRKSSEQVGQALDTVARIADYTRILSINASIEAARAGVHGQAFAVVVDEVQELANRTSNTTKEIEVRMKDMRNSIIRVETVASAAAVSKSVTDGSVRNVAAVNNEVAGISSSAQNQLEGAESLHAMGESVHELAEVLLLAVGSLRLGAHRRAEKLLNRFVPELKTALHDRDLIEESLIHWLAGYPEFELAYLTNSKGVQTVDNIVRTEDGIRRDPTGSGRNWSDRSWFQTASANNGVYCTDVYRSTATGDFCFTVSTAIRDSEGSVTAVLAADLNFRKLIDESTDS